MDVNKSIEIIGKARDEAIKKVASYARPKTIAATIELLISIVLSFGVNFIALSFDFSVFKKPEFYVKSLCTLAAVVLIFRAVINARFNKTANRPVVLDAKSAYKDLNSKKEIDMKIFLEEFNLRLKTEAYVQCINQKMYKLEKKMFGKKSKKIEKLEKKMDEYRYLISKEFISQNIEKMPVKYIKVYYSDFNDLDSNIGTSINTRENYDKALNKATLSKIGWYIVTAVLLGVGLPTTTGNTGAVALASSSVITLTMIVWRIVSALTQADVIYDNTITKSILVKTDILKQYFEWKKNNPTEIERKMEEERKKIKAEYEAKAKAAIERLKNDNKLI